MIRRTLLLLLFLAATLHGEQPSEEARFLTQQRQLIYEGKRSGEGYFSPDGQRLVFQSEREEGNPFYQIYTLDLQSGETARVSPGVGKTTCAFFEPGSGRVLFASTHLDPQAREKQRAELEFRASGKQRRYAWDYDAAMDLFTAKADGTDLRRLTEAAGYDAEASYSPDGKLIVFCSLRSAYEGDLSAEDKARLDKDPAWWGEIYLMNADGPNVRRLTSAPGYDGGPFFSPDGQRIVWRRFDASGMNADVFTMKLDGSDVRRLTDFHAMSWAPYFHPSGEYLIFTSNKLGFENFELFLVDAAGAREPVRVTFTPGFDGLPVFSPDGKRLCWTSGRTADGKSQLFMAEWNHAAARTALRAAEGEAAIAQADLRRQIEWLTAEARGGRATGSDGARATAEWLADYFRAAGVKPVGADYFQPFQFEAGVKLAPDANRLDVALGGSPASPIDP
jgi:Tol biopolymer transport system component